MNRPKFTPGPRETDFYNVEDQGVYMVKDSLNQAVCECFTQYPFAGKPGITDDEAEANARLIAAAPELYEMLASIRATLKFMGYLPYLVKDIDLILSKARGESEVENEHGTEDAGR